MAQDSPIPTTPTPETPTPGTPTPATPTPTTASPGTPTPTTPTPTTPSPATPRPTKVLVTNLGRRFTLIFSGQFWNIAVHQDREAVTDAVIQAIALALNCDSNLIYIWSLSVSSLHVEFSTASDISPTDASAVADAFANNPSALAALQALYTSLTGSNEVIGVTAAGSSPTSSTTETMCGKGCVAAIVVAIGVVVIAVLVIAVWLLVKRSSANTKTESDVNGPIH
jgi:hypothetical protein